jgi:hypothetical protein
MRRPLAAVVILFVAVLVLTAAVTHWWPVVVGTGMLAVLWPLLRCHHPGPLGLLPPVVDDVSGERLPARWYCDHCGQAWPAGITHGPTPVQRFSGYDQTKAQSAARRASELAAAQRDLAVRRSGAAGSAAPVAKKPRAVPFGSRRRPEPIRGRLAG